ncbi:hypothetical protein ODS41_11465 [Pyrobaculum sp. 3827-6]|uniref:hypothetical protein n=1 Tax=Pyrobaculum sp. 3827-6 TaxID=2983604 RepID=UPI0021DAC555|nr:hypothetical protein [Pyrobaculum sp. 3827-6]MCU7788529.1 hypothetical protein [Pyrobaculum sp. 3827-6]
MLIYLSPRPYSMALLAAAGVLLVVVAVTVPVSIVVTLLEGVAYYAAWRRRLYIAAPLLALGAYLECIQLC